MIPELLRQQEILRLDHERAKAKIPRCPRCGGQILHSYDETKCLQCGYNPEVTNYPGRKMNGGNRMKQHNDKR